jgi:hypothetical protein
MKAPEIKSGKRRKGESGKEREGKGEEREEKGERERDKQQWGETCGWVAPLFACELLGRGDVFHGTRN